MQKCQAGAAPDTSIRFTQTGGGHVEYPDGPAPPNAIFPGDAIHVVIDWNSSVHIASGGEQYDVNGKSEIASSGYPFPGWPEYADLFRLNNNPSGWVASGSDPNAYNPHLLRELADQPCFAAPNTPVRMGVQINGGNISANSGLWSWTLQIWRTGR
jgi:hypothetical protein